MKTVPMIATMTWYHREDYPRLLALFSDRHKLHEIYDEWLQAAETGFTNFEKKGHRVVKVFIRPDEIQEYCRTRGLSVDAAARTSFANERLREMHERGEITLF